MSQGYQNIDLFQHYPHRNLYIYTGTLERGMLLPINKNKNSIVYGEPIQNKMATRSRLELIGEPLDFFTVYSPQFEDFLKKIYRDFNLIEIDVEFFFDAGKEALENKRYEYAALCLEAALQVEKSPGKRALFLNHLVHAYAKTGRRQDSIKILNKLQHRRGPKLYDIFPERGI